MLHTHIALHLTGPHLHLHWNVKEVPFDLSTMMTIVQGPIGASARTRVVELPTNDVLAAICASKLRSR